MGLSNRKSRWESQGGRPRPPLVPAVRFYTSKGEPRVEVRDEAGAIDVSWKEWQDLVNMAGVAFTRWVLTHPGEYAAWVDRVGRLNGGTPRRRWWQGRG